LPSAISSAVPRELEKLIARCLRKDPEHRVHSMVDVRLTLDEIREESDSGIARAAPPATPRAMRWPFAAAAALALVAAAGYYVWSRSDRTPYPFKATVLTSFSGVEQDPALSPDGKQVAFSWNGEKEDNFDIYVKLVDAGSPVRITKDP